MATKELFEKELLIECMDYMDKFGFRIISGSDWYMMLGKITERLNISYETLFLFLTLCENTCNKLRFECRNNGFTGVQIV